MNDRSAFRMQQSAARPLWRGLAYLYGWAVRARAVLYARQWLLQRRLPCRVVSVGNLTVGGTGKTPLVIAVATMLRKRGQRVAVLSRGYRRQRRAARLLVSDGRTILASPAESGDEPYLIAQRCPGVVVAVGADRFRLGRWVLERFPLDCVVLDDGFQHLGLHRDVDLLLVDASAPEDLDALLPAGRLREPLAASARASAILLTRAEGDSMTAPLLARLRAATGVPVIPIRVRFRSDALVHLATGAVEPMGILNGRAVVLFSGIAKAPSFRGLLVAEGAKVCDEFIYPDHHSYTARELGRIRSRAEECGADLIVTTEKDAVKVAPLVEEKDRFWALRLQTDVLDGRERLERLILGSDTPALRVGQASP
jgi:tetraacyldisaccharide 4'-kinase